MSERTGIKLIICNNKIYLLLSATFWIIIITTTNIKQIVTYSLSVTFKLQIGSHNLVNSQQFCGKLSLVNALLHTLRSQSLINPLREGETEM